MPEECVLACALAQKTTRSRKCKLALCADGMGPNELHFSDWSTCRRNASSHAVAKRPHLNAHAGTMRKRNASPIELDHEATRALAPTDGRKWSGGGKIRLGPWEKEFPKRGAHWSGGGKIRLGALEKEFPKERRSLVWKWKDPSWTEGKGIP